MTEACLSLGSNMGRRERYLTYAACALSRDSQIEILKYSSLYNSAPCLKEDQPDFINAVLLIRTSYSLAQLGAVCRLIEDRAYRERYVPYGPRTLDIDIIFFGEGPLIDGEYRVPHMRFHERAFVLKPLYDMMGDIEVPPYGPISTLLSSLSAQRLDPVSSVWINEPFPNGDQNESIPPKEHEDVQQKS